MRNDWVFRFEVRTLRDAAKAKCDWHEEKITFWTHAEEALKRQINEFGTHMDDDEVATAPQLKEVQNKLALHRSALEEMARWHRAFEMVVGDGIGSERFDLSIGDVTYFGL